MRRLAILAILCLGCAAEDPPPGSIIGTFDFIATMESEGACILEEVSGVPQSFSFSAILSHEPGSDKLWFRAGATEQSGTIEENRFAVVTPSGGGGIPRTFPACTVARQTPCPFMVVERIEASILSDCSAEFSTAQAQDLPCPEIQEDGRILWHNCACVRGTLEEVVRFEPEGGEVCTCVGRVETEPFEGTCRLIYRLEGEKR